MTFDSQEEISWQMIEFYDNQPCIDLIEDRVGILAMLDEECHVPQGSDQGFVKKLHDNCAKYLHLMRPRFGNAGE
jgi:myosin V